jgi:hypothetical protein
MLKGKQLGKIDNADFDEAMWTKKRGGKPKRVMEFTRGMQSPAGNVSVRNPIQARQAISGKTAHGRGHSRKGS